MDRGASCLQIPSLFVVIRLGGRRAARQDRVVRALFVARQLNMQVQDSNGEISASVEETNRVRAELGLKPLAEGGGASSKEDEARKRGAELAQAEAKEDAEEALREKLESAKRQRLLHQKLQGSSLGEMLEGEEMDSAMGWIEKSRKQEELRKQNRKEGKPRKMKARSREEAQVPF